MAAVSNSEETPERENPGQGEAKPLACVVCKKTLRGVFEGLKESLPGPGEYVQPLGANTLSGSGTYGSRRFDPLNGWYVIVNICDECLDGALKDARAEIRSGPDGELVKEDSDDNTFSDENLNFFEKME